MRTMKVWRGFAFTAVASNHAGTVSLRIDSPPAGVRAQPFRPDCGVAFTGEAADFRETLQGFTDFFSRWITLRFVFEFA